MLPCGYDPRRRTNAANVNTLIIIACSNSRTCQAKGKEKPQDKHPAYR